MNLKAHHMCDVCFKIHTVSQRKLRLYVLPVSWNLSPPAAGNELTVHWNGKDQQDGFVPARLLNRAKANSVLLDRRDAIFSCTVSHLHTPCTTSKLVLTRRRKERRSTYFLFSFTSGGQVSGGSNIHYFSRDTLRRCRCPLFVCPPTVNFPCTLSVKRFLDEGNIIS
jgi:hypothetical protein